jgi:hypothetical protein
MKKIKNKTVKNRIAQKRAKKSAQKLKKFRHQKYLWNQGIGLYEIYTKEERD